MHEPAVPLHQGPWSLLRRVSGHHPEVMGTEKAAGTRLPLAEAKAVAHAQDGKADDLLLSIVTGGLRALLIERGEPVDGLKLLTSVPVSIRHDLKLGNEVGIIIVPLPIGNPDPDSQLQAIVQATGAAKRGQSAAASMMGWSLIARMGLTRLFSRRQRFINVLITNVAGPPKPVYVLGAGLLDVIPVTPIAGDCTLGFAALSDDGCLAITVVADAGHCPDLDVVAQGMQDSWAALEQTVPGAVAP